MVQSLSGKFVNDCRLRVAMLDAVSSFRCWRTALEEGGEELRSRLKFLANRYLQGSGQHGENDGETVFRYCPQRRVFVSFNFEGLAGARIRNLICHFVSIFGRPTYVYVPNFGGTRVTFLQT